MPFKRDLHRAGIVGGARCRPVWLALLAGCASLAAMSTASARSPGAIRVSGHRLIGVDGHTLRLIGVDRSGTEYACSGPDGAGGFGYGIFQGPDDAGSIKALRSWHVNAVALPLNEACWLGGYAGLKPDFSGSAYQNAIVGVREAAGRCGHLRCAPPVCRCAG